jgi:hypothetical protein
MKNGGIVNVWASIGERRVHSKEVVLTLLLVIPVIQRNRGLTAFTNQYKLSAR